MMEIVNSLEEKDMQLIYLKKLDGPIGLEDPLELEQPKEKMIVVKRNEHQMQMRILVSDLILLDIYILICQYDLFIIYVKHRYEQPLVL